MAYPFPEDRLPSPEHFKASVPLVSLPVEALNPTQYYVRIDRLQWLAAGNTPEGDDYPHVVTWRGKTYLYDGHHRWMLASLTGVAQLTVRNFIIESHDEITSDQAGASGRVHLATAWHADRSTPGGAEGSEGGVIHSQNRPLQLQTDEP